MHPKNYVKMIFNEIDNLGNLTLYLSIKGVFKFYSVLMLLFAI